MRLNIKTKIKSLTAIAAGLMMTTSCNYLDVVPVEQPDIQDLMTDASKVRDMLFSCYGYCQTTQTVVPHFGMMDGMADDIVCPQEWDYYSNRSQWNIINASTPQAGSIKWPWDAWYEAIGYCNLFLEQIEQINFVLSAETKKQYIAEANYLKAFYNFRLMQFNGPIPIIDKRLNPNIPKDQLPGRSHFDYCVHYVDSLLGAAEVNLPAVHSNNADYSRATSVMCKALRAKMMVLAASPLWNGQFPDKTWKNKNYETPGYGLELVSHKYDSEKWVKARQACIEAIKAAESAGHKLYDTDASENQRLSVDKFPLPNVPNCTDSVFKAKVVAMRYLMSTRPDQGNSEVLWGIVPPAKDMGNDWYVIASNPSYILTATNGERRGSWGGLSATLRTVEHFYTKDGIIPENDPNFTAKEEWFKSAGIKDRSDVINLCVNREPRFYAWVAFDGDEFGSVLKDGSPLMLQMRSSSFQGYSTTTPRNYSPTGFLNKKWVHPNLRFTYAGGHNHPDQYIPKCIMRLSDFYLYLAECDAQLGSQYEREGLEYLNKIRTRAGVPEMTKDILTEQGKTLLEAVLDERFIEFYAEHSRYHDIRRYVQGPKYLSKSCFMGLDAKHENPSFEKYNTPVVIDQPFNWNNRQYLTPIRNTELYANPQLVQAPGY